MISLHGGGSPAAMKQEIWRNYPVGNKVELVERLLNRGLLNDPAGRSPPTASRAAAATPAAPRRPRRRRWSRCRLDTEARMSDPSARPTPPSTAARSSDRDAFWAEQARADRLADAVRRASATPASRRSCAGSPAARPTSATTRSIATWRRGREQPALIYVSTETDSERIYSFAELHAEVQRMAAVLVELGVGKGDRVLIYMPMIPEAAFAMLACARIGAIHSVVFGGFASVSLASRIDDAEPKVIVSADAGSRAGKVIAVQAAARRGDRPGDAQAGEGAAGRPRPGADGADAPGATRPTRRCASAIATPSCPAPGSTRPTRATPSTPAAPPAGRRACSATPAATRWRWPRA